MDTTFETLKADAEAAHAQYPQYAGSWDGWTVGTVTKRIKVKGRATAFEPGDVVLVDPEPREEKCAPRGQYLPYEEWPVKQFRCCYSFRTGNNTYVPAEKVRV